MTTAYTRTLPFTVYFNGCQDAYLVATASFKITAALLQDESATYTNTQVGFTSSDTVNCPLGTGITATYSFATTGGASSLANYWAIDTGQLKVTRSSTTTLNTEVSIVVTATDSNSVATTNTITLAIVDQCNVLWNCKSCSTSLVFDSTVLPTATQTIITDRTVGCTACYPGSILKYKADSTGSYYRQCILDRFDDYLEPSRRMLQTELTSDEINTLAGVGQTCGLGMLYSLTTDGFLKCDKTCSDSMPGCTLCSSSKECTQCSDTDYVPSNFLDAVGEKYSKCTTDLCVDCIETTCPSNCQVCSNLGSNSCIACKSGFYMNSSGVCATITGTTTLEYYV